MAMTGSVPAKSRVVWTSGLIWVREYNNVDSATERELEQKSKRWMGSAR